jgi:hypothetical protein
MIRCCRSSSDSRGQGWLAEDVGGLSVVRTTEGVAGFAYRFAHPTGSALEDRDPVVRAVPGQPPVDQVPHVIDPVPPRPPEALPGWHPARVAPVTSWEFRSGQDNHCANGSGTLTRTPRAARPCGVPAGAPRRHPPRRRHPTRQPGTSPGHWPVRCGLFFAMHCDRLWFRHGVHSPQLRLSAAS